MEFVITILILNSLLAFMFIVHFRQDKQAYPFLFLFLAAPVFGLALYYIPHLLYRIRDKQDLYNPEDTISDYGIEDYVTRPRMEEEMNIIPFEEAMAISDAGEKRGLLLGLLKANMSENVRVTMSALEDKDSETSHYAAAATMEIARKLRNSIQKTEDKYQNNKEKPAIERQYIDELFEYIDSGILSERDRRIQISKYMKLSEQMMKDSKEQLFIKDYRRRIGFFIELNQLYEAEHLAKVGMNKFEDEEIYLQLMDIYFRMNNRKEFDQTLKMLRNSNVVLSATGINVLRFWLDRGDVYAAN